MVYKWYILPIGWLYGTYHLLREPETAIEPTKPTAALLQQSGRAILIQSKRWTHKLPVKRFGYAVRFGKFQFQHKHPPTRPSGTRRTPIRFIYTSPDTEFLDWYGYFMGPADMGRVEHHPILPLTCWEPKEKNQIPLPCKAIILTKNDIPLNHGCLTRILGMAYYNPYTTWV